MRRLTRLKNPYIGLIGNLLFALGNSAIGFFTHSWWFITVGAYYAILTVTRFSVLQMRRKTEDEDTGRFVRRVTGMLLLALALCLTGINTLSAVEARGTVFHEIVMIAIATYSFAKITVAIVGLSRARRVSSQTLITLRHISLADAFVSIYSLQRSMLVSFPGMEAGEIRLFNILTGTAVFIILLLLGINLIGGRCVTMAKSKLVEANQKIADAVTDGYKKIEKGVVEGYKKIEKGVVEGYAKIEDKFVDAYLTRDGETVEEAKARLKKEDKE